MRLRKRRGSHEASAHDLFGGLVPLVRDLRRRRLLDGFFFMRKAPGLRLRFAFPDRATRAGEGEIVDHLNRVAAVSRWFPSCYEPETFQFGGPAAMEVVHAHASADALAWWQWERRASRTIASTVLSLCVLNDLFCRVLDDDAGEVWDVWCHLAAAHGAGPADDGAALPRIGIAHVAARASAAEQVVLRAYQRANRSFASAFRRLHARGQLLYARRLVLPYVALFHWNRFGFALAERQRMYGAMTRAWSSKRHSAA